MSIRNQIGIPSNSLRLIIIVGLILLIPFAGMCLIAGALLGLVITGSVIPLSSPALILIVLAVILLLFMLALLLFLFKGFGVFDIRKILCPIICPIVNSLILIKGYLDQTITYITELVNHWNGIKENLDVVINKIKEVNVLPDINLDLHEPKFPGWPSNLSAIGKSVNHDPVSIADLSNSNHPNELSNKIIALNTKFTSFAERLLSISEALSGMSIQIGEIINLLEKLCGCSSKSTNQKAIVKK